MAAILLGSKDVQGVHTPRVQPSDEQCDITFSQRLQWGQEAVESLTEGEAPAFLSAAPATLVFAPIGTISNPAGTYGAIMIDHPEDAFPGDDTAAGSDYCSCLQGNSEVSSVCDQLGPFVTSGGDRENQCSGSFVLAPSDAVIVVACAPPQADYFGLQTNVLSKWLSPTFGGWGSADGGTDDTDGEPPFSGKGCYDSNMETLADCSCHPSCASCGFNSNPTNNDDCASCTDGGTVQVMTHDNAGGVGKGYCGDEKITALFYPEISPLDTINHLQLNTTTKSPNRGSEASPWGHAFVVVSTADKATAEAVKAALISAGVPAQAINLDRLWADYEIRFWDGDSSSALSNTTGMPSYSWETSLPDTLETVWRINGANDSDAMGRYIAGSTLGSQRAWILRAPPQVVGVAVASPLPASHSSHASSSPPQPNEPLAVEWRPRVVAPEEGDTVATYGTTLDAVATSVNASAVLKGLTLSYYGDFTTSMNFGYEPSSESPASTESDVGQCCLRWPMAKMSAQDDSWLGYIHFSTRDCLYETHGWLGRGTDEAELITGEEYFVSTDAIGPVPENLTQYLQFVCNSPDAMGYDAMRIQTNCMDSTCGHCAYNVGLDMAGFGPGCYSFSSEHDDDDDDDDGDDNGFKFAGGTHGAGAAATARRIAAHSYHDNASDDAASSLFVKYGCVNGEPDMLLYADDTCSGSVVQKIDLGDCNSYVATSNITDSMWAGGVMREGSVVSECCAFQCGLKNS